MVATFIQHRQYLFWLVVASLWCLASAVRADELAENERKILAGAKRVKLSVSQDYGAAKNTKLPVQEVARCFLRAAGYQLVTDSEDGEVRILVRGKPSKEAYGGGRELWGKAETSIFISWTATRADYSKYESVTRTTTLFWGNDGKSPDDAPFEPVLRDVGIPLLTEMITTVSGASPKSLHRSLLLDTSVHNDFVGAGYEALASPVSDEQMLAALLQRSKSDSEATEEFKKRIGQPSLRPLREIVSEMDEGSQSWAIEKYEEVTGYKFVSVSAVETDQKQHEAIQRRVNAYAAKLRRTFTDRTGEFSVDAAIVRIEEKSVRLVNWQSKQVIDIPLDKLSRADQIWIEGNSRWVRLYGQKLEDVIARDGQTP